MRWITRTTSCSRAVRTCEGGAWSPRHPVNNAAKLVARSFAGCFWRKTAGSRRPDYCRSAFAFRGGYYAAPLLIANGRGLIVNTSYYGASPITPPVRHMARRRLAPTRWLQIWPRTSSVQYCGGFRSGWVPSILNVHARTLLAPKDSQPKLRRESTPIHRKGGRCAVRVGPAYETLRPRSDRCGTRAKLDVTDVDWHRSSFYRYEMGGPPELHGKPHSLINADRRSSLRPGLPLRTAIRRLSFLSFAESRAHSATLRGKSRGFGVPDGYGQVGSNPQGKFADQPPGISVSLQVENKYFIGNGPPHRLIA